MANNLIPTTHIIGSGVIGSLLACNAVKHQYPVQQYVRKTPGKVPSDLPAITVKSINGDVFTLPKPLPLSTEHHPDDQFTGLIIIPVKAYQMEQALTQLHEQVAPSATLLLLHNGMGSIDIATRLFPNHCIIAGTTTLAGFKADNQIKHTATGQTQLGIVSSSNASAPNPEHIALINQLVPEPNWHTDILLPLFNKLAVNCVINPLTAIHDVQNGELSSPRLMSMIKTLIDEVVNVAAIKQVTLHNTTLFKHVLSVIYDTRENFSSMHQDIKYGRKSEIEQINGYVVALGEAHGIDVSRNKSLLQQILAIEKAAT